MKKDKFPLVYIICAKKLRSIITSFFGFKQILFILSKLPTEQADSFYTNILSSYNGEAVGILKNFLITIPGPTKLNLFKRL